MNDLTLYEVIGSTAVITLNRPEKRNALSAELIESMRQRLRLAVADNQVRAVVIRGAGTDFCSGADLSALQKISESTIYENLLDAQQLADLFTEIRRCNVPVIAAVHGRALAGGCGLATACDIVLAARSARFGYPEVKIGFVPAMVMAILRRNVSEKRAFELVTLGAEIDGEEALRLGLVNRLLSDEDFASEVAQFAAGFAKVSRTAVALSKRLLYHMDGMNFESALQSGVDLNAIARMTDDCQAGIERFLSRSVTKED